MKFVGLILGWVAKNAALVVGIVESLAKLIGGVVSLTPTKRDDFILPIVDKIASDVKKYLYVISDKLSGKDGELPNS